MENELRAGMTRRAFLRICLAGPVPFVLAACGGQTVAPTSIPPTVAPPTAAPATAAPPTVAPPTVVLPTVAPMAEPTVAPTAAAEGIVLAPTPACDDGDDTTPSQTEGPYFTPNSPERTSLLEPGMAGTRIVLTGLVRTTACVPVARALVDFWHADDAGVYDNVGYRLRGHQFTDEQGRYTLETIVPGLYPGRTRHFHVKVQAPNQPILTTQLYFPDEPSNASDGIFSPELLIDIRDEADGKAAVFDFVLQLA